MSVFSIDLALPAPLDQSPLPAIRLDENGRLESVNKAFLDCIRRPETVRPMMSLQMWWGMGPATDLFAWISSFLRQEPRSPFLITSLPLFTTKIYWSEAIQLDHSFVVRGVALDQDAGELALLRMREGVKEVSTSLSHDLRKPIRILVQFSEVLSNDASQLSSQHKETLKTIVSAGQELASRFESMVHYLKKEYEELTHQELDLKRIVDQWGKHFRSGIEERGGEFLIIDPLPVINADRETLVQVIGELISNAFDHVPSERIPKIEIWSEQSEKEVLLHVRDNGVGFDPGQARQIFGFFSKVHATDMVPNQGVGMGLTLARRWARIMGMEIVAEGAPGVGATFTLVIPRSLIAG